MSKAKKIIFTGISGLLGSYFLKNKDSNYTVLGISSKRLKNKAKETYGINIVDKESILDFAKAKKPDIIVHAASIGNVDYCETHKDEAYKVNVVGTRNVIDVAREVGAKLIFTSSNAIFDGEKYPFGEKSKVNPVDYYGKTKVEGENLIKKSGLDYCILRLMTMYGWNQECGRPNPATWVIDKLKKKEKINVVSDVYNNHLWAGQAADVIWKIIEKGNISHETYNLAGKDCISRYKFAIKVAKIFGLDSSLITPVKSSFFKNLAARPKNTCFNTMRIEKKLKIKPLSVDEGIKLMKKEKND